MTRLDELLCAKAEAAADDGRVEMCKAIWSRGSTEKPRMAVTPVSSVGAEENAACAWDVVDWAENVPRRRNMAEGFSFESLQ